MKRTLIILLAAASQTATVQADSNLPNLDGKNVVEGVMTFSTPKKVTWYLPNLFASDLRCSEGIRSAYQTCVLRVTNAPTEQARAALNNLQASTGQTVSYFTSLESQVVKDVRESIEGEIAAVLPPDFTFPQSLTMNATGPYLSFMFRVRSGEGAGWLERFESSGVGTFRSSVGFNGEHIGDYIAIKHPELVLGRLRRMEGRTVSKADAASEIRLALQEGGLILNQVAEQDALRIASDSLRIALFGRAGRGYRLKSGALQRFMLPAGERLILVDDTSQPQEARCDITLELKRGAVPQVNCTGEDE